ncbi:hypothetical protein ACFYNO_16025 [Kitasatospora sp. NPDC006697]|uniref:hypothetical protein n=1 Tax=Kitasatospora sp. NPDC006697 TaxID=3364020 RepID=UPI0036B44811
MRITRPARVALLSVGAVGLVSGVITAIPAQAASGSTYSPPFHQASDLPITAKGGGGDCPGIPSSQDGWNFVLPGSSTDFVSLTVTFQPGGTRTITSFGPPDDKHANVGSAPGAQLTGATAVVTGGSVKFFNLSHMCPATSTPTPTPSAPTPTPTKPSPTPTTPKPTTPAPTTPAPTTPAPTTPAPTSPAPTTPAPTTPAPTTPAPTTSAPESPKPSTPAPSSSAPTTPAAETSKPAQHTSAPASSPAAVQSVASASASASTAPAVLAADSGSATPSAAPVAGAPATSLAFTGTNVGGIVLAGLSALLIGGTLLVGNRKRAPRHS